MTTPEIAVLAVPYDSGHSGERMGAGPGHLLDHGLLDRAGPGARAETVRPADGFAGEIASAFRVQAALAERVRAVRAGGRAPLVLAGNCNTTVGVVAGLRDPDVDHLGVVWFDAHGDFNTPETSTSGFLDGMGLAVLTGDCWRPMAASVPGFRPLPERHVVLAGIRDVDAAERDRIERSALHVLPPDRVNRAGMAAALTGLPATVRRIHLHLDLDVHDRDTVGRANPFAVPGGPDAAGVRDAVAAVAAAHPVVSATISAYDPAADPADRLRSVALDLAEQVAALLHPPAPA
ncbi:arginase [Amycolatopsis arida]|uniref:Arginase n=1 Tax=Amycolatopsis arida TaxID=587909 RepID=A0A1I5Z3Q5_9PSEU|nr:arginase family protein [Amycolatopsis arida]TDX90097.1 arginase [Amycolatopsis arida]SFQ50955.1 arginase [Amycolatopsis arida]